MNDKKISKIIKNFIFENTDDIIIKRTKQGVNAYKNGKEVGYFIITDDWEEQVFVDDEFLDEIKIPKNYEFASLINSEIKGLATEMVKYALETTTKKGIAISKHFIVNDAIITIMKKLKAKSISDWFILNKKNYVNNKGRN